MNCPHCSSSLTSQLAEKTSLGYKMFHCLECKRKFNERTGTPYNHLQFPTDIVLLVRALEVTIQVEPTRLGRDVSISRL